MSLLQVAVFVYPTAAIAALSMFSCWKLDGDGDDLKPGEVLAATGDRWTQVGDMQHPASANHHLLGLRNELLALQPKHRNA